MKALCFRCPPATFVACKALGSVWRGVYGSALAPARLREIPFPEHIPAGWARVRVTQCGLCSSDLHLMRLDLSPRAAPAAVFSDSHATTVLGHELVGVVEAV